MTRKVYVPQPGRMAQVLVMLRRMTGRSQESIADRVGLSRTGLAHRETGYTEFTVDEADRYLRVLGCKLAVVPVDMAAFDMLADRLALPRPDELITDPPAPRESAP